MREILGHVQDGKSDFDEWLSSILWMEVRGKKEIHVNLPTGNPAGTEMANKRENLS